MAKQVYKIPYGLNASYGDMSIALRGKDGIGTKPIPLKVLMAYLVSILLCFFAISKTVIGTGTLPQIIIFVIVWAALTLVLVKHDGTGRMQIELLPTLANYVMPSSREVITRNSADAMAFYRIAGIESITSKGFVTFTDGTYGYFYRVVGSASVLLFEDDRNEILKRVEAFYRKMNTEAEVIFVTTKASQTVYKQINALKRRYDRLQVKDPELMALAEHQFQQLKGYVGSTFKSIHQYVILKADNKEMLHQTKNVLQSEVENSTRMIKRCVAMYRDDIEALLSLIYTGKGR